MRKVLSNQKIVKLKNKYKIFKIVLKKINKIKNKFRLWIIHKIIHKFLFATKRYLNKMIDIRKLEITNLIFKQKILQSMIW